MTFIDPKSRASTLLSINESDLILIKNYNKLVANELIHGKFEVEKVGCLPLF